MKKVFLLGVGAQKSGTTWLHQYLSSQKNYDFGACKEYHIWDALYIKECHQFIAPAKDNLRFNLQNVENAYATYFNNLIINGVTHTGDITPSYAGLPPKAFGIIKEKIEAAGFELKVIFLMRDPFERCWSAVRMLQRNGSGLEFSDAELLRQSYKTKPFELRTNYHSTIQTLESVFSPHQLYFGFYEDLFHTKSIQALSEFCDCPAQPSFASKKFNTAPKLNEDALALKSEVRQHYAAVYAYCEDRFPQTQQLWKA